MEEKAFWEKRNFIQSVWFELPEEKRGYPFDIEAVAECGKIELEEPVTILTGENGSGKSKMYKPSPPNRFCTSAKKDSPCDRL